MQSQKFRRKFTKLRWKSCSLTIPKYYDIKIYEINVQFTVICNLSEIFHYSMWKGNLITSKKYASKFVPKLLVLLFKLNL